MPPDRLAPGSPEPDRRSYAVVILSVAVVGLAIGITAPLSALVLERQGVEAALIGLSGAMTGLGILASLPLVPRLLRRLGPLGALPGGIALVAVMLLAMGLWPALLPWYPIRFLLGIGMAVTWVASESWISLNVPARRRGRAIALYMTVLSAGLAGGPLLLTLIGSEGFAPFAWSAGGVALAGLPPMLVRGRSRRLEAGPGGGSLRLLLTRSPTAFGASLLCGLLDGAAFTLLVLYGLRSGAGEAAAIAMLSAFVAGNLLLQYPLGWLGDRNDRRRLLIAAAVLALAAPALLPLTLGTVWLWPVLVLWGGVGYGFYTLGLALLAERVAPQEVPAANATFVGANTVGLLLGPLLGGVAMDAWDPHGLPAMLGLLAAAFLALAVWRTIRYRPGTAGGG